MDDVGRRWVTEQAALRPVEAGRLLHMNALNREGSHVISFFFVKLLTLRKVHVKPLARSGNIQSATPAGPHAPLHVALRAVRQLQ
jgi:hypothetical protein